MKHFFTTFLLLVIAHSLSFCQCTIPGGDFEDFQEIPLEDLYEVEGDIECSDTTIFTSPDFFSALRLFELLSFDFLFSGGSEIDCQEIFELEQYNGGANGTSAALKLQPDTLISIADAFYNFSLRFVTGGFKRQHFARWN